MDKYRFREVREEYNKQNRDKGIEITQEDMAYKCGAGKSTISRIEKGEIEPSINVLLKYADEFNVSTDYLLRYTNAKNPEHRTVSHELGLSDEAIETLKFIKENAAYEEYDIAAFLSAFVGSGETTFRFFDDLMNLMSAEYGLSKYNPPTGIEKQKYSDKLVQDMANRIQEYVKYDIQPELERVVKQCYEAAERSELYVHNQFDAGEKQQE